MKSLQLLRCCVAALAFTLASVAASPAWAATTHLDRVFLIVMENQGFDDVIGHQDASGRLDTPNITNLAMHFGLQTWAFGVTHPSLPNYLAMIGGYDNNIADDEPSCFAVPNPAPACHSIPYKNLIDELETAHISWTAFEQSMPSAGFLGARFPATGPVLYAQKHNPFVYYRDIATNPARLNRIVPIDVSATQLRTALAHPATAPRFVFIVPDQCHDMHGTSTCTDADALLRTGDSYVGTLVNTIRTSPSYTASSAIFITWDENDFSSSIGCCGSGPVAGGHIASIVITPRYTVPLQSALPSNHYTLLATIEDAFGVPRLGKTATVGPTYFPLLP